MDSVKSLAIYYVKYVAVKILFLSIGLFYAAVGIAVNIFNRIRIGPEYFEVKERTLPPACLQDAAYGRHAYINIKVSSTLLFGIFKQF